MATTPTATTAAVAKTLAKLFMSKDLLRADAGRRCRVFRFDPATPPGRRRVRDQLRSRAMPRSTGRDRDAWSCESPSRRGPCVRVERGAQGLGRVVKARLGRPDRDPDGRGGFVGRHAEVVMQDDDRPVLDRQSTEHPPDLVSIRERGARVGVRGYRDNGQGDPIAPPLPSLLRDGTQEDQFSQASNRSESRSCGRSRQQRTRAS